MKTKLFAHQNEALRRSNGNKFFAYLMQQGTGKSITLLADAENLYGAGHIDAIFILAPRGVHTNWSKREIPAHMDCPMIVRSWRSGAGVKYMKHMEQIFTARQDGAQPPLRILTMNYDAVNTKAGYEFAERFLNATKALFALDESGRIKNPKSARTIKVMSLRSLAVAWRILTGTPITNAPADIFQQFEFMRSGLLGTTSYRAFVSEYADLLDVSASLQKKSELAAAKQALDVIESSSLGSAESMIRLNDAVARVERAKSSMTPEDYKVAAMVQKNSRVAYAQIVQTNNDGSKRYRNLDKLQKLIEPHAFRVLKKDCLELPSKIYKTIYFELGPKQQAAYELMQEECRIELLPGEILSVSALAALTKLQQITSGFVMLPNNGGLQYVSDENPRLEALIDIIEDYSDTKIIVWAKFKEELRAIAAALRKLGRKVVEYHGDVNEADREIAVDTFQNGDADVFVGQPQSGGIGLTLTASELAVYYSNSYNKEHRWQSEDRNHRIGTKNHVLYIDLIADETIDESIVANMQNMARVAAEILGDNR